MRIYLDLDGTITDILPRHYRVYQYCVDVFHGRPLQKGEYWKLKRSDASWQKILLLSGIDPSKEKAFLKSFIALIEDPKYLAIDHPFKDSITTLEILTRKHELILVSLRRNRINLENQLNFMGLSKYFQTVLSGHSETKEGTLTKKAEVIRRLGSYRPGWLIGDTEADIVAGKQLGIKTIALDSGIRDRHFLEGLEPDYLLSGIGEVTKVITK